jgi:hypothetical protein
MDDEKREPRHSIWDACKQQQDREQARKQNIAARYRARAKELGAQPGEKPGEWQLQCPHCGAVTFVSERGEVYRRQGSDPHPHHTCAATSAIQQYCSGRDVR